MPRLITTGMDRERFYMDYVNTCIERDIKELAQVGRLNAFYDFLVFMAARTSHAALRFRESIYQEWGKEAVEVPGENGSNEWLEAVTDEVYGILK